MYIHVFILFQLRKLAAETGEESIVISTNVSLGTYNHLGSGLGQEYLQDGGMTVEVLCENFMSFCKSEYTTPTLIIAADKSSIQKFIFSYFSTKLYVVCINQNCLNEEWVPY